MKKYILNIAAILVMTLVASCTKDQPTNLPNYSMENFPAIVETVESPVTAVAIDGNYELVVSGITEAHSHEDVITLKAVLNTYIEGALVSSADMTSKCVWSTLPYGIATVNGGKYTSVYKGSLSSYCSELTPGIIPESRTCATVQLLTDDYKLEVRIPILFRQTVHIGFDIQSRKRESDGLWEFQAVASYPVPYQTCVIGRCGHAGTVNWMLYPNTTKIEYLTNPDIPVTSEQEAKDSKVVFVNFNEKNHSNRFYDNDEKVCYFLHPQTIVPRH